MHELYDWVKTPFVAPLNGYKVVFVPFSEGRPSGPAQDVVTGFLDADNEGAWRGELFRNIISLFSLTFEGQLHHQASEIRA
jgi:hypothetical protein